jgi:hypothetical protein
MGKVFISYSHKDEVWKDRLVTHLSVLKDLEIWDDRRIMAGEGWLPEIEKAIESAHIAILLITANFLSSKFILKEEIPRLFERKQREGLKVIPLIVRPCAWKKVKWLKPIQARPKDGKALSSFRVHKRDEVFASFVTETSDFLVKMPTELRDKKQIIIPPRKTEISILTSTSPDAFKRDKENRKNNLSVKHRCFISYDNVDQESVDKFCDKFEGSFIRRGIAMEQAKIDSDDLNYVMRRIRELYLLDSTVTIVLIGKCTWARKFVDWEIQASLRQSQNGLPNGLVAIQLMESFTKLPERVKLNVASGYSKFYKYPSNTKAISEIIEEAFDARIFSADNINNPRDRYSNNKSCK